MLNFKMIKTVSLFYYNFNYIFPKIILIKNVKPKNKHTLYIFKYNLKKNEKILLFKMI